jgi:hypothetical protein
MARPFTAERAVKCLTGDQRFEPNIFQRVVLRKPLLKRVEAGVTQQCLSHGRRNNPSSILDHISTIQYFRSEYEAHVQEKRCPTGACSATIVYEIEKNGRKKLVASCLYPVEEGLSLQTKTEKVTKIRRMIIEVLWPAWQAYAHEYGVTESRFDPGMTDCTLCGLCALSRRGEEGQCALFQGPGN